MMGINGILYAILPLTSMAAVERYCEERTSGFWIQRTVRTSQRISTAGNLISSSIISVMSTVIGMLLYALFVMLRFQQYKVISSALLLNIFFVCCMSVMGTFLSILVVDLTKSKFYSLIIPLLIFYSENEIIAPSMDDPQILILDEPMNSLDKQGIEDVRNLLKQMRAEGKTVLLTSHNYEDIISLCDRVFEMEHGKMCEVEKQGNLL